MVERFARSLWVDLPRVVARRSPVLAAIVADGAYLIRWPRVALLAPILSFAVGFVIGAFRPLGDATYAFAIAWPLILLVPSAFGAGLGLLVGAGYAVGDFFVHYHQFLVQDPLPHIWTEVVPLLIVYELLLGLTVLLPLAARTMPIGIVRLFATRADGRARHIAFVAIAAVAAAILAASWSGSAQVLQRPIETFRGGFESPAMVQPLRTEGILLVLLAAILTGVRALIEIAAGNDLMRPPAGNAGGRGDGVRTWRATLVRAVIASALLTLLLSGLLDEPWQAAVLFVALLVSALLRLVALPRLARYAITVNRIPVLLRILVLSGNGYVIGAVVLPAFSENPPFLGESWGPMLLSASIMIVVAAFLVPAMPSTESATGESRHEARQ
jgi:hypothetical protein